MPFSFTLSADGRVIGPSEDLLDIAGEDISLQAGEFTENANGDLATVTGAACARQSAIRETIHNPGSFPRRPLWGAGVAGLLFKGNTPAIRDRVVSRTRARLLVNPRITKVHEVSASLEEYGTRIFIRCDTPGGFLEAAAVVRPPGV